MSNFNGKYLNEENHQKGKKILKTVGLSLLIIGAIILIIGIMLIVKGVKVSHSSLFDGATMSQISEENNRRFGLFAGGSFCVFLGFAFCAGGVSCIFKAHAREIVSYHASTIAPVAGETANYMADAVTPSINKIAEGITESIEKGKRAGSKKLECSKCGALNDSNAKFCNNCGVKFKTTKHCSQCGQKLDDGAKFCNNCGAQVEK